MNQILYMSAQEAYMKCRNNSRQLADEIWKYKHLEEEIDTQDSEYISWNRSIPYIVKTVVKAGLENLDMAFELPTPLGDYIDVAIIGTGKTQSKKDKLLIIELKQWSVVSGTGDSDYVKIPIGKNEMDDRRHPVSQICEYREHMLKNHHGIYKNDHVAIDAIAYLHNLKDKEALFREEYNIWKNYEEKVYIEGEEEKLIQYLQETFINQKNNELCDIVKDCGYIMGKAGFAGLRDVLQGEENTTMIKDQMSVVDYVRRCLKQQKENAHPQIIIISGGAGTGKTIVGMHFIYDYADIFNEKRNADGAVFCLPKSRTVKAVIDHECNKETVPYLQGIGYNQNLVVVDEAHRITEIERTLDEVFHKGTKLLVLLQDDHQRIRADEEGTVKCIENYAKGKKISCIKLKLSIQKRCKSLGKLLNGLDKMFYDKGIYEKNSITLVRTFHELRKMERWVDRMAESSRAKFIAPYCWKWNSNGDIDIAIEDNGFRFTKLWNPNKQKEQVSWYYGMKMSDKVASIYTCQGLELDNVGFIWWDDLRWDEKTQKWKADITKSRDSTFRKGIEKKNLSEDEVTELFINTYYVMLSRAKNRMGIWFKDEETKHYVTSFLGLKSYDVSDEKFNQKDIEGSVLKNNNQIHEGVVTYVDANWEFAYIQSNGKEYPVTKWSIANTENKSQIYVKDTKVTFSIYHGKYKDYANNIKLLRK